MLEPLVCCGVELALPMVAPERFMFVAVLLEAFAPFELVEAVLIAVVALLEELRSPVMPQPTKIPTTKPATKTPMYALIVERSLEAVGFVESDDLELDAVFEPLLGVLW